MNKNLLPISLIDELKASIKLGSPLILTNLAQVALLTTNLIFIGRLGKTELAAGSLAVMWKLGLPIAVTFTLETLVFYGLGVGFMAFGVGTEGVGIWIGFVTGLSVVAALLTIRWWHHTQRLLKQPEFHYG